MKQFLKFAFIGTINTALDIGVLTLMMYFTGINVKTSPSGYSILKAISFSVATANSYIFNKFWTFRDKTKSDTLEISQFAIISIGGVLINVSVATIVGTYITPIAPLVDLTEFLLNLVNIKLETNIIWSSLSAAIATSVSLIWNFLGYKFIVFKK